MEARRETSRIARNGFKGIAAILQQRIEAGSLEKGRYLPTERELQLEFGASRSTVRRAISALVESGWAQTVPSKGVVAGGGSRKPRTNNVALVDGATYVLRVLMIRLSELLRERGYYLVHLGGSNNYPMEEALEYAAENEFAAAIVWPFRGFPASVLLEQVSRAIPLVCLDHRIRGVTTDLVTFDYLQAGYEATTQLIRNGCRRIAVTGMLDMLETTHDRFSGYMKALFDHDLQPIAKDFVFSYTSGAIETDHVPLLRRLGETDRPDGLLVLQDEFAPGAIQAILEKGVDVPNDLKIVTIGDDVEVSVDDFGITSVALDWEELCVHTLELVVDRLRGSTYPPVLRTAAHRLIVRGTCGSPRSEWSPHPEDLTGFHGTIPYPRSQHRFSTNARRTGADQASALDAEANNHETSIYAH